MGSWRNSRTTSTKILWLILPLMAVTVIIGVKKSNYGSKYNYPWIWSSGINSYSSSVIREDVTVVAEGPVSFGRRSTVVKGGGEVAEGPSENFGFNSSYPPLAMEDEMDVELPAIAKEDDLNATLSAPDLFASTNQIGRLHVDTINRKYTSLDKLEARLGQVRAAIKEAESGNRTNDPDYVPYGPMYWNAASFHRSYLEMEKQFKVFVYEEGEPPIFHNGPCKNIYAMEGNFIYHMETTKFRTKNPEKAHTFFLPMSATMMVRFIFERDPNVDHWRPMKQTIKDYVDLVGGKYPFWNRSLGADHFTVACHDWGPELSKAVPYLFKNSIRALCNANTSEGFNPSKDVSIPEILLPDGTTRGILNGPSPRNRPILAFFAGGVHGPIRPILLEHWQDKDPDLQVHKYLPKGVSYMGMLRQSKYCISPSGYEVASPRMVEALYTGCVPVLIKDHYVAPFSDVLNWKSFAVILDVQDIPNLKSILTNISTRQYLRMQRRGKQVRRHFEVNYPPKRYDVFHMILHSVWLRRLNIHIQSVADS
ncbi:probable glycosyltransferase At5g03795 [Rutidosis leptorrhynchoides]|uniref:probable glycosyltransferase At5g03795 n=1 Tax=Rutidosis leptorrhynchoides TaxID=125765 RepID=UPI003A996CA3